MHKINRPQTSKSKLLLAPIALSEGAATTQWIDRHDNPNFGEGEFQVALGAFSGSPSSLAMAMTIQTSPNKTDVTTAKDENENDITVTATTAGTLTRIHFVPEAMDRYYRLAYNPDFTGGSSPTVVAGITLLLEDARHVPVDSAAIATEA